ncbi:MAG: cystathionine beta-synthase [Flavobacteriales bacterium]
MKENNVLNYIGEVLKNMPDGWLNLTTHRLDIYDEQLAKVQFLEHFEHLFNDLNSGTSALNALPTAFDYIRLGHPLSCVLEWVIARLNSLDPNNIISFSSKTIPVLAILRANLLEGKETLITYSGELPGALDLHILRNVYGYTFDLKYVNNVSEIPAFHGSTIFITQQEDLYTLDLTPSIDFFITIHPHTGSVLSVNGAHNERYISDIQHVRRRESIAMTPANCLATLRNLNKTSSIEMDRNAFETHKAQVLETIKSITGTPTKAVIGSSGLSIQYAIMMGLIHDASEQHPGKNIKIIVPPNCYGGTNDQARRVAACFDHVEVLDLHVDGGQNMVQSIDSILTSLAATDDVPYIIAEIPTNPRVEVPNLMDLKAVLSKERNTANGGVAIDPVFILDQTFCPNVHFLGEGEILSKIRAISYASGSKFPSGGKCTAGYCVGNKNTDALMEKIELHLKLSDNEATSLQTQILAQQLPSMNQRIKDAYINTRDFVNFIQETLPEAKINFVSQELAEHGFTPSVFSLDLPTQGDTDQEKESYKRDLNHKLINLMITEIPSESKYCVSYGQLNGCYWTIPATSTQGTTKEGDKDYIARVALSPNMNLELHKEVFKRFVEGI